MVFVSSHCGPSTISTTILSISFPSLSLTITVILSPGFAFSPGVTVMEPSSLILAVPLSSPPSTSTVAPSGTSPESSVFGIVTGASGVVFVSSHCGPSTISTTILSISFPSLSLTITVILSPGFAFSPGVTVMEPSSLILAVPLSSPPSTSTVAPSGTSPEPSVFGIVTGAFGVVLPSSHSGCLPRLNFAVVLSSELSGYLTTTGTSIVLGV